MKLNFWQILGTILVIVALIYIVKREMSPATKTPATQAM